MTTYGARFALLGGVLMLVSCRDTFLGSSPVEKGIVNGLLPGRMAVHRMSNAEYDNTVRDLLGTTLRPGRSFLSATATGFDTNAAALASMSTNQLRGYYEAARELTEELAANEALRARIIDCAPAAGDSACARSIAEHFGRRAWRRPLNNAEIERLIALYGDAQTTLGQDPATAILHMVRGILSAPQFYYRVELDTVPESTGARAVDGYEFASRLSYLVWSSMPDDELFALAESGALTREDVLAQQVDRLLADPKGAAFIESFFGQWFFVRQLDSHVVSSAAFPAYTPDVEAAMLEDAHVFFTQFMSGGVPWNDLLKAAVPTSPNVAALLGETENTRKGLLTLPAFLTVTSKPDKTLPTLRGKVIVQALFCRYLEPPPGVGTFDDIPGKDQIDPEDVRAMMAVHRADPSCAGCHNLLDPLGLGLEGYDAIGRMRTTYASGLPVDTSGELGGTAFQTLPELVAILGETRDAQLRCAAEKLFSYALRRSPAADDSRYIEGISTAWNGATMQELVHHVVASDAFRYRGGDIR